MYKRFIPGLLLTAIIMISILIFSSFNGSNQQQNKEYKIISNLFSGRLEDSVSKYLAAGYSCAGGLTITESRDGKVYYMQAVVK